jgi:hypothetical protein
MLPKTMIPHRFLKEALHVAQFCFGSAHPHKLQMKEVEIMRHMLLANNMSSPHRPDSATCATFVPRWRCPSVDGYQIRHERAFADCYDNVIWFPHSQNYSGTIFILCVTFPKSVVENLGVGDSLNNDLRKLFEPFSWVSGASYRIPLSSSQITAAMHALVCRQLWFVSLLDVPIYFHVLTRHPQVNSSAMEIRGVMQSEHSSLKCCQVPAQHLNRNFDKCIILPVLQTLRPKCDKLSQCDLKLFVFIWGTQLRKIRLRFTSKFGTVALEQQLSPAALKDGDWQLKWYRFGQCYQQTGSLLYWTERNKRLFRDDDNVCLPQDPQVSTNGFM